MGEQSMRESTPYGPAIEAVPVGTDWLRQWAVQTAAVLPLGGLTALIFGGGFLSAGTGDVLALLSTVQWLVVPLLVWAAAMAGLAALLRERSAAVRAGWSALGGAVLAVLPVIGGGVLVVLLAAMLACCQVGYAAVARELAMSRRVGFAIGGALAALAGAAAVRMGFGAVLRSDDGSDAGAGYGLISALILVALLAAVVLSFRAGRKGWAVLAIIGLAVSALSVTIAAPREGSGSGAHGGFDPATVPEDDAECSFDASRPGCGG